MIRINKYLSLCGITSRRGAEQLIKQGRVVVNDLTLDSQGTIIDEYTDTVKVDGVKVRPVKSKLYVLLNKPKYVLTSLHDPFHRRTVADCLKNLQTRLYPVGRLDYDTTGALIMTNDGNLAYRLAHPKYKIEKVYQAVVRGYFSKEDADVIKKGVKLPDGHIARALIKILASGTNSSRIGLILTEGRKREVKNILKAVKHPVIYLQRVAFAGLGVDDLKPGRWKYISRGDVKMLKKLVKLL